MKAASLLLLFFLINHLLTPCNAARGDAQAKSKKKPKDKPCKYKKELAERRSINFVAKNPENTIWPFEWSYIKAKIEKTNIPCGVFEMRVVDVPLRRLIHKDNEWELMGIGNHYLSKQKNQKYNDEEDIADIPIHLLSLRPRWSTRNPIYKRVISQRIRRLCKTKAKRKSLKYRRCLLEKREAYLVGAKAYKPIWNVKFGSGWFSRKAKTYKLKINPDHIPHMHPGINGVGAINKASALYTAYKSFAWLTKYLEINLNIKYTAHEDNDDDAMDIEDDSDAFYAKQKKIESKNNIQLSIIPILHYSRYDNTKCGVQCEKDFEVAHRDNYAFDHEFVKFVSMESSERLGTLTIKFKTKFVHSLGLTDAKIPNLIKKNKNIKLSLKLDRLCGRGGVCSNRFRSVFGLDGWDLLYGEQVQFALNMLGNRDDFKLITYQNPIITALFGANTIVFGKGMRRKSMTIKATNSVQYGMKYKFQYSMIGSGAWHKWYLYYSKLYESEKGDYLAENEGKPPQGKSAADGCTPSNMYSPRRPLLGCDWGSLKTQYEQEWYVEMPKPGSFEHSLMSQYKFSKMKVSQTKCGKIEAKLEEWPVDGNKYYIKLLLKPLGTEGGVIFEDEEHQILRYPERKSPGEINIPFRKYTKKWCVTAKAPGGYIMTFSPYGSLLNLFPNPPSQIQINVDEGRMFKISIEAQLDGITVFNNQWSDVYKISINAMPDKDRFETDLVVTPTFEGFQFSPTQFVWSPNTPINERKRRKKFKFRPLLECAFGGVVVQIEWSVTGMVNRVAPYPIPHTQLRVTEHIPSDGCSSAEEADHDTDDEFVPLEMDKANVEDINTATNISSNNTQQTNIKPTALQERRITLVIAVILLTCFGFIILCLCAFGCLGNDDEFELLVATQLRKAIINKQKQMVIANMNSSATENVVDSHYNQNVNARQRLRNQNQLLLS